MGIWHAHLLIYFAGKSLVKIYAMVLENAQLVDVNALLGILEKTAL
jgi:hypothetical protein